MAVIACGRLQRTLNKGMVPRGTMVNTFCPCAQNLLVTVQNDATLTGCLFQQKSTFPLSNEKASSHGIPWVSCSIIV